jgi:hypothetical protein
VRFFKGVVLGVDYDLATEEEKNVQLEFCAEADGNQTPSCCGA